MAPTSPPPMSSKSICEYFYAEVRKHEWQCKKCLKLKSKNGGWTNLLSHIRTCVGSDYENVYLEHKKAASTKSTMSGYFVRVSELEKEMFSWIRFIVMKNLPVSFVDCTYTRDISRLRSISGKSLRRHILSLRDVLKETLRKELPSRFVVVFDGWTEGTHHYIGVAASYMKVVDGKEVPIQTMLSMQPLLANGIQGMRAVDHIDHLSKVLGSYGKSTGDIICLVGDNCQVNQSMARTLNIPLLGCASHKFNLAVRRWIAAQSDLTPIITKVSWLCVAHFVSALVLPACRLLLVLTVRVSLLVFTGWKIDEKGQHSQDSIAAARAHIILYCSRE
jgi:hypothetical protein